MANTAQHTPTPWELNKGGFEVNSENGSVEAIAFCAGARVGEQWSGTDYATDAHVQANAAFIVKAANSHQALVDALRDLLEYAPHIEERWDNVATDAARAALAAAGAA